jgi:hypothetical protein
LYNFWLCGLLCCGSLRRFFGFLLGDWGSLGDLNLYNFGLYILLWLSPAIAIVLLSHVE